MELSVVPPCSKEHAWSYSKFLRARRSKYFEKRVNPVMATVILVLVALATATALAYWIVQVTT